MNSRRRIGHASEPLYAQPIAARVVWERISRHGVLLLSGGCGRLDIRLDTRPSIDCRHPDSGLAPAPVGDNRLAGLRKLIGPLGYDGGNAIVLTLSGIMGNV
jgi:hypothetical protein